MPNWCMNTVRVCGPKTHLKKFIKKIESEQSKFDFNQIVPMPEELKDIHKGSTIINGEKFKCWRVVDDKSIGITEKELHCFREKFGAEDWYDWAVQNWGTKWNNADEVSCEQFSDTDIEYSFDTAWSPPLPVIEEAAKLFPKLTFEINYEEPGMDFSGYSIFENGELTGSEEHECDKDDDEEWIPMSKMV